MHHTLVHEKKKQGNGSTAHGSALIASGREQLLPLLESDIKRQLPREPEATDQQPTSSKGIHQA
jgi:hypothetical protein